MDVDLNAIQADRKLTIRYVKAIYEQVIMII